MAGLAQAALNKAQDVISAVTGSASEAVTPIPKQVDAVIVVRSLSCMIQFYRARC